MSRRRDLTALLILIAWLAATNVARSTIVASRWHLAFNISIGAGALLVAAFAHLDRPELGLAGEDVGSGLRWGGGAFALVAAAVVVLGLTGVLTDSRVDIGVGQMVLRTLVVIPLGTVLVEELAFRGVLHGLLRRLVSLPWTFVIGAVLFGLWHVLPAWRSGGGATGSIAVGRLAGVAGTFAATTGMGLVFIFLRVRSRSLLAPVLAHVATNSVTFAVAWSVR